MFPGIALLVLFATAMVNSQTTRDDVKARPTQRSIQIDSQKARPTDYMASALRNTGVWGGIEDYSQACDPEAERVFPAIAGNLQDVLISVPGSSSTWVEGGGGVLIKKSKPQPSVLDVSVAKFTYSRHDNVTIITDELLRLPVVQRRARQLHASERTPELGFAQLKSERSEGEQVTLTNVTVREVLNSIAQVDRPRVWLYRQTNCNGRTWFLIQWLVK